jgi:hypothetical protein
VYASGVGGSLRSGEVALKVDVAGATLGAGIAHLVNHARSYAECMTAAGYARNQ